MEAHRFDARVAQQNFLFIQLLKMDMERNRGLEKGKAERGKRERQNPCKMLVIQLNFNEFCHSNLFLSVNDLY